MVDLYLTCVFMLRALAFAALLTIGLGALVFVPTRTATSNSGGAAARNAGVPGENTCASSGCHSSFALNSGNGSVVVASADTYTPGTALDLTVRVAQSGSSTYGFQIAARDANGDPAGSFELADGGTRFSGSTTIGQRYVGHSTPSVSGEWSVRWLAEAGQVGDVTFYATGNAANGNGSSSGDWIYSTSRTVLQGQGTPVEGVNQAAGLMLIVTGEHPIGSIVRAQIEGATQGTLSFYDALGRMRMSAVISLGKAELSRGGLEAGLYLLVAETTQGRVTRSVVLR